MLLTTLVLKHQAGKVAQPEKPPMFEEADVEMCAHSRAVSVSISAESATDKKERVYLQWQQGSRKNCSGIIIDHFQRHTWCIRQWVEWLMQCAV